MARPAAMGLSALRSWRQRGRMHAAECNCAMTTTATTTSPQAPAPALRLALALSLGAAVSLGITRFSYALLLPPMRADLGWSYTLAGGMNTANAAGYLLGGLVTALLMRSRG